MYYKREYSLCKCTENEIKGKLYTVNSEIIVMFSYCDHGKVLPKIKFTF